MYNTITEIDTVYNKEELKQSYTRIIFIVFIFGFYLYQIMIDNPLLIVHSGQITILFYLIIFGIVIHNLCIHLYPRRFIFLRRHIIMSLDFTVTSLILYCFEADGIYFAPLYLWITIGNGIRYGAHYIFVGIPMALIMLGMVLYFSAYWAEYYNVMISLAIAIIILPLFYLKLLNRLAKKNKVLQKVMKQMEYHTRYDDLTNIFNRKSFDLEIKKSVDLKKPFALFFIDLNDFKMINDTYGHFIGDMVLQQFADQLKQIIGKNNFVARLGGDEFVIIKYDLEDDLNDSTQKICKALSRNYDIENFRLNIQASIGVSLYPEDTTDISEFSRYADTAMYEAKKNDKIKYKLYSTIFH